MARQYVLFLACLVALLLSVSCARNYALRQQQAEATRRIGEGYMAEGDVTSALRELLKAEKLNDKDPILHYDLGLAYMAKQETGFAMEHFERALKLRPDYSEALNAMGTVYLGLKQWDKAISFLDRARDDLLYGTPHMALNNLGEAYRGKNEYGRAIGFFKKALEMNPRFVNAHRGLGLTSMDMGNYEAAVTSLEKAVRHAPRFADVHFELGRAYLKVYRTKKAISVFHKVVELVPESPLAEVALAEIGRLQR